MERPEHITFTRSEAFDILATLDEVAEELAGTDKVGLLLHVEEAIAAFAERLLPEGPTG